MAEASSLKRYDKNFVCKMSTAELLELGRRYNVFSHSSLHRLEKKFLALMKLQREKGELNISNYLFRNAISQMLVIQNQTPQVL